MAEIIRSAALAAGRRTLPVRASAAAPVRAAAVEAGVPAVESSVAQTLPAVQGTFNAAPATATPAAAATPAPTSKAVPAAPVVKQSAHSDAPAAITLSQPVNDDEAEHRRETAAAVALAVREQQAREQAEARRQQEAAAAAQRAEQEAACAEARRRGYEEGFAEGDSDARGKLAESQARLSAIVERVEAAVDTGLADAGDLAIEVVYEAICKVFGDALMTREAIVAQVRALLARVHSRSAVTVRLHPRDLDLIGGAAAPAPAGCALTWVGDDSLALGGCVIVTAGGEFDARLETILEHYKTVLARARREESADTPAAETAPDAAAPDAAAPYAATPEMETVA